MLFTQRWIHLHTIRELFRGSVLLEFCEWDVVLFGTLLEFNLRLSGVLYYSGDSNLLIPFAALVMFAISARHSSEVQVHLVIDLFQIILDPQLKCFNDKNNKALPGSTDPDHQQHVDCSSTDDAKIPLKIPLIETSIK